MYCHVFLTEKHCLVNDNTGTKKEVTLFENALNHRSVSVIDFVLFLQFLYVLCMYDERNTRKLTNITTYIHALKLVVC